MTKKKKYLAVLVSLMMLVDVPAQSAYPEFAYGLSDVELIQDHGFNEGRSGYNAGDIDSEY